MTAGCIFIKYFFSLVSVVKNAFFSKSLKEYPRKTFLRFLSGLVAPGSMAFSTLLFFGLVSPIAMIISGIIAFGDGIMHWLVMFFLQKTVSPEVLSNVFLAVDGFDPSDQSAFFRFQTLFLSIRALFMSTLFVWVLLRKEYVGHVQEILVWIAPPAVFGTLVGCYVLDHFGSAAWLRPLLGILISVFATLLLGYRLTRGEDKRKAEDEIVNSPTYFEDYGPKLKTFRIAFFFASFVAAFLGATCTIASPPGTAVVIILRAPKRLARRSLAVLFHIIFVTRVFWTVLASSSSFSGADIPKRENPMFFDVAWREALVFVVGGAVGLAIGNEMAAGVSNSRYLATVTAMLFVAGLSLATVNIYICLAIAVVLGVWVVWTTQ